MRLKRSEQYHKWMRGASTWLIMLLILSGFVSTPQVALAQSDNFCPPGQKPQFILGFAEYKSQHSAAVGEPVECEHHDAQGNGYQRTTTGQLVWTKSLNAVTFFPLSSATPQSVIQLPPGFQIEKVVGDLTYPTALSWDDQGRMFVAEAGGGLNPEQLAPSRILRIEPGQATEVVNLTDKGVVASVVGLTWHDGAFYFTHRNAGDLTGAVSKVTLDGAVTPLFSGIIDSKAEHQINDIKVGPDGRMYVTVGPATNAGVVGPDLAPWVMQSPDLHTTVCQDIVLTGRNFRTPDFRTMDDPNDMTVTGAFVPFGTVTTPGQVIPGTDKCGGSILVFDPNNAEATIHPYAWGFRNLLGLAWDPNTGEMYVAQNGYDIRGARSVNDEWDPTYRVREGAWYGWPDFSATFEPVTDPKFAVPDNLQAPVIVNGEVVGKDLGFLIDHAASGLTPPDKSLILGLHGFHSSPSFIDVAPASWGDLEGHVFVAEWGDLTPPTDPLFKGVSGYRVSQVNPATGEVTQFVGNRQPGGASMQGAAGNGIERPFDVKFGPDGALYIVDYGIVTIDPALREQGKPPYNYVPKSGIIWRVTRTSGATTVATPETSAPPTPAATMPTSPAPSETAPTSAQAEIRDVQGRVVGEATFTPTDSDAVRIHVEVSGYNPVAGSHGIHIHAVGECEPPFTSAGGHFNPTGAQHGLENPQGPHAGDLPNMQFYADGSGEYEVTTNRITLGPGERSIFDEDGSAIVIHASPDDQVTDPAGNSGDRIGCGVIMPRP
ncbi:MAG: superoxide dismutase family protein [Chloroflexota bacterium]|nr:superoxide dismutase family protein [Chloroflexota bacterium]